MDLLKDYRAHLSVLMTIFLAWLATKLLGNDVKETAKFFFKEAREFIGIRPSLESMNFLIVIFIVTVMALLITVGPYELISSDINPNHDAKLLPIMRLGASLIVAFLMVLAGLGCVFLCKNSRN